ncbi:MAG: aldo/keto reductase [Chlorobi bacterium]|nr:aldo/keto reductase [Chlorobiota bacterium]
MEHPRPLGNTGLMAGRLGISSSYGAPAAAFEEAFERGCNYFTWGTFIRGRSSEMAKAVRDIVRKGQRDKLILAVFTYWHNAWLTEKTLIKGLKKLGTDYVDVLLLGWHPRHPAKAVMEGAEKLQNQGLARYLGLSSHRRTLFPELFREGLLDVYHIRYNAVHRGAEQEVFPFIPDSQKPGIVSFTATCWGKLLKAKKMPQGEEPLTAADCYRFVLSDPAVDVCMIGAKTKEELHEDLKILDMPPLSQDEIGRIKKTGDYIYHS